MAKATSTRAPRPAYRCAECGWTTAKWVGRCGECQAWGTVEEAGAPGRPLDRAGAGHRPRAADRRGRGRRRPGRARPAWTSSTACSAAGWWPGPSCCWPASPASASRPCCSRSRRPCARAGQRGALRHRRGVGGPGAAARRADRRAGRRALPRRRDRPVGRARAHRGGRARRCWWSTRCRPSPRAEVEGAPGGVTQVREVAGALIRVAKDRGLATVLVGHVTKDGSIAGPRAARAPRRRRAALRGRAARTGCAWSAPSRTATAPPTRSAASTSATTGITGLPDPSGLFLSRRAEPVAGTCVTVTLEGRRPLVAEVQALVAATALAVPAAGDQRARLLPGRDGARGARAPRPASAWASATSTPPPSAACASASRPPTSRWRWRWPAAAGDLAAAARAPSRSARWGWPARSAGCPASSGGWPRPRGSASPCAMVPPGPVQAPAGLRLLRGPPDVATAVGPAAPTVAAAAATGSAAAAGRSLDVLTEITAPPS